MSKMVRRCFLFLFCLVAAGVSSAVLASSGGTNYYRGQIVSITGDAASGTPPVITVRLLGGPQKGQEVSAGSTGLNSSSDIARPTYHPGNVVVIAANAIPGSPPVYSVLDHYRFPPAIILLAVVVGLAILFAGWRGIGSLAGLGISLVVIGGFVVPQIIHGHNPYLITLVGCFIIATSAIYVAHGFSRRTTLALISSCLTFLVAAGVSAIAVAALHLNGIASEDISYLHQQLPSLNLQGLLFGGIMIGVLGVLDDITVGQATAVEELHRANPNLNWRELYRRALRVGREHISSLINTLVLAYAGTSLLFIVYVATALNLPLWLSLNSELVMEEIARSLIGSLGLILAVPIATLLAAYFLTHPFIPTTKNAAK